MKTIPLTNEHLRKGTAKSCHSCPIALAIADSMKMHPNVRHNQISVIHRSIKVFDKTYHATEQVGRFVRNFDNNGPVSPGTIFVDDEQGLISFKSN